VSVHPYRLHLFCLLVPAIVLMVILTTLLAPPLLKRSLQRMLPARAQTVCALYA
jgi:hypothetical protein